MRDVEVTMYVLAEDKKSWAPSEPTKAKFHQWGTEVTDGVAETVAIVELEDGSVKTVLPERVKFL